VCLCGYLPAQDLAPRAYVVTPIHANAVTVTSSFYHGGLDFNGTVPVSNASGTYGVPVLSIYHSFNFFGKFANVTASLPYGVGTFSGDVQGTRTSVYRSGLLDFSARVAFNIKGGPALEPERFVKWKQKTILACSFKIVAPTGQYSPARLINWGTNRWAFKPELAYSKRWTNWLLDGYGGVWFYTDNHQFFSRPAPLPQSKNPIGSLEAHLSYDWGKIGHWASLDGNFWWGGITALNGVSNDATRQTASRIGGTISVPWKKHQSFKFAYSYGTYVRFGGNYHNLQAAWQYSWLGRPK
jgi:hypothetical protein